MKRKAIFLKCASRGGPRNGESDPENALTNEEAEFIRDNIGQVAFWWQKDREDLMVTTPDGRRMNIVDWIIDPDNNLTDEQILFWMNQTEYFQNHKDAIRKRDALWHTAGPGVRQQLLEDPRGELLREAQRIGFNWLQDNPALLDKLAYDSYRFGGTNTIEGGLSPGSTLLKPLMWLAELFSLTVKPPWIQPPNTICLLALKEPTIWRGACIWVKKRRIQWKQCIGNKPKGSSLPSPV